jgi:hypothetical protein
MCQIDAHKARWLCQSVPARAPPIRPFGNFLPINPVADGTTPNGVIGLWQK